jgi:hypothetical protein
LRAALRVLSEHATPDRDVVARVDGLAARALATAWESARVKEPVPLPAIDPDRWPDRVAQMLVALDAAGAPWRVVAAERLRRAADRIAAQQPPHPAFSFAGRATARAYETLQRVIVGCCATGPAPSPTPPPPSRRKTEDLEGRRD